METSDQIAKMISNDINSLEKLLMRPLKDEERELYIKTWMDAYEDILDGKAGDQGEGGFPPGMTDWQWCISDWARTAALYHPPTRDEQEQHARKKRLAKQAETARLRLQRVSRRVRDSFPLKPGGGPKVPRR